jgi:hypothetical protein
VTGKPAWAPPKGAPTSKGVDEAASKHWHVTRHHCLVFKDRPDDSQGTKNPRMQKRESELHSVSLQRGGLRLGHRRQCR